MRLWALLAAGLIATPALAQAPSPTSDAITFIAHDKVDEALHSKTGGPLFKQSDLVVQGCFRDKPGVIEIHQTLTNIFYITDGEATLVIGGESKGAKMTSPGQLHGGVLTGARTYHAVKGDVFVIRPGVPTWFKAVPKSVSYYVVQQFKP
ncbi:MAG TPA: hypothetical protein VG960_12965 [Caulobacteraceae bacterium]|nr:hypothetical protein [Caulobacteraceae bacterium]